LTQAGAAIPGSLVSRFRHFLPLGKDCLEHGVHPAELPRQIVAGK
jgi:hypothetical protein